MDINTTVKLKMNSPWLVSERLHLMLPEKPGLFLVKIEQTLDPQVVEHVPGVRDMCL